MHIVSCEHPKSILSPYSGEIVTVPCGKCPTCLNVGAIRWINKLDTESRRHKYTYMVTLTYDDENVPRLGLSDDMESLVFMNRNAGYSIPLSEIMDWDCKYMKDEHGEWLDHEVKYLRDRLLHPLGLPCTYNKDFQDFNKRFNKYCFSHVTQTYQNFRFFACFEYGGTTYRNHYHALYFFDDDRIARRFDEILSACWTFGNTDGQAIYSDAGRRYVAAYANMHSHLPTFYNHPKFKERVLFSRCPSIGSDNTLEKEIPGIYDRLPLERFQWVDRKKAFSYVPVSESYKARFFPKIAGFDSWSDSDRVRLYGIVEKVPSSTYAEFRESADLCHWLKFRGIANESESVLVSYCDMLHRNGSDLDTGLKRLYRISLRINYHAHLLRTSTEFLVKRIVEFYKKYEYEKLKRMYEFQSDYSSLRGPHDLVHCYPQFVYLLHHFYTQGEARPYFIRLALRSFGFDDASALPPLESTYDYKAVTSNSHKIYKDTHKRHASNRYRDGKLYKRDKQLSLILKDFQKWQTETLWRL